MSDVWFPCGPDRLAGWFAEPSAVAAPWPAVVLIPDVRGLSDHFRAIAGRFANEGFAALALDLYSREGAPDLPDMESVLRWMQALDDRRVLDDIQCAVDYLAGRGDIRSNGIGITGFCMGGQYALMAACSVDGLAACVSWYGMLRYASTAEHKPESPLEMAERLSCPYLGLFGEADALIPLTDVEELRARLERAGKDFQIVTYPKAGHAFFNDTRPDAYRPDAARDAWARCIAFFRRHLGAVP